MKIGILGYFGYGNIGDETILEYELRDLTYQLPEADFVIITNQSSKVKKDYHIKTINKNLKDIKKQKIDVLLWGGGWILYDSAKNQKAFQKEIKFLIDLKEYIPNIRIILYATSIGPIREEIDKKLSKSLKNIIDEAFVRDRNSIKWLESIDYPSSQIKLVADIGYEVKPAEVNQLLETNKLKRKEYVVLSLSDFITSEKNVLNTIIKFMNQHDNKKLILPAQYLNKKSKDLKLAESIGKKIDHGILIDVEHTPEIIAGLLGKSKFVVSNRLHIAILSSISGIPVIGINIPKKMGFFFEDINQPWLLTDKKDISIKILNGKVDKINSQNFKQKIQKRVFNKREDALQTANALRQFLRVSH